MNLDNEYPLVTFLIKDNQYALSSEGVSTMVAVPETRPVPHAPPYVRGIINLRGKVIPLIDLRLRLGYTPAAHEHQAFESMMAQREQDHRNWLKELEASVRERRDFTLTTDPHQCAFGKWFDTFEHEDNSLMAFVRKFNRPHRKIHALAHRVEAQVAQGNYEAAQALIDATRNKELKMMVKLFAKVTEQIRNSHREIAMIVETPLFDYGVAIDQVLAVEFFQPGTIEPLPRGIEMQTTHNIVGLMGRRQADNTTVQILDPLRICDPQDVDGLIVDRGLEASAAEALTV